MKALSNNLDDRHRWKLKTNNNQQHKKAINAQFKNQR